MIIVVIFYYCSSLRKGEELKAPRHASAAAARDGNLPVFLTIIDAELNYHIHNKEMLAIISSF